MTDLTQEQFEKAINLYEQSFYGSPGFNNGAQDSFADQLLGCEKLKLMDLVKEPNLSDRQKIEVVDLLQAVLRKHCENTAIQNC